MSDDDKALGDPKVPQPGDPTEVALALNGGELQAVISALNELPAKFSRRILEKIERQVEAQVLDRRRQLRDIQQQKDAERAARANGHHDGPGAGRSERDGQ